LYAPLASSRAISEPVSRLFKARRFDMSSATVVLSTISLPLRFLFPLSTLPESFPCSLARLMRAEPERHGKSAGAFNDMSPLSSVPTIFEQRILKPATEALLMGSWE
jgi:hypothetical protein